MAGGETAGDTAKGEDSGQRGWASRRIVAAPAHPSGDEAVLQSPVIFRLSIRTSAGVFYVTMVRRRQTTRRARSIVGQLWRRGEDDDEWRVPSGCFFSSLSDARVARLLLDRRVRITKGIGFELFSS
nr:hypothetical protein Iba_chr08cCG8440 [Ipomoea batatas]GMD27091.1 hypothetical protein Iba_chr08dCG10450 [Ipomoea batatas]GMD29298.1 hypothetical protein Iba_chr08fCG1810 [Ipomoea batatas]GME08457.1 hypothetical protein Iba_scaffold7641CG0010 [Ipomoea batatas]